MDQFEDEPEDQIGILAMKSVLPRSLRASPRGIATTFDRTPIAAGNYEKSRQKFGGL